MVSLSGMDGRITCCQVPVAIEARGHYEILKATSIGVVELWSSEAASEMKPLFLDY